MWLCACENKIYKEPTVQHVNTNCGHRRSMKSERFPVTPDLQVALQCCGRKRGSGGSRFLNSHPSIEGADVRQKSVCFGCDDRSDFSIGSVRDCFVYCDVSVPKGFRLETVPLCLRRTIPWRPIWAPHARGRVALSSSPQQDRHACEGGTVAVGMGCMGEGAASSIPSPLGLYGWCPDFANISFRCLRNDKLANKMCIHLSSVQA